MSNTLNMQEIKKYTVRVELHGAEPLDYPRLHTAMEGQGITQTIDGNDKKKYKLPKAEYSWIGRRTIDEVFALAKNAARSTGDDFSLLISEVLGLRKFYKLDEVAGDSD